MVPDNLAIVGGGSVATSFVYQFVTALEKATLRAALPDVAIFEPAQRIGRGSAYAEDLESNLLNVPVGGMSVSADDKLHFSRWLERQEISTFRGTRIHEGTFVSRALFGQYLESVHSDVVVRARAMGLTIHHIRDEVTSIEQAGGGAFTVRASSTALPRRARCSGNRESGFASLRPPETPRAFPFLTLSRPSARRASE